MKQIVLTDLYYFYLWYVCMPLCILMLFVSFDMTIGLTISTIKEKFRIVTTEEIDLKRAKIILALRFLYLIVTLSLLLYLVVSYLT